MLIFAGSYERFLFGFQASDLPSGSVGTGGAQEPGTLERRYTFAAHQNAVKCVAAGGHWLASGGCDDQIHLYDMKHGRDAGFLMNPGDGAVPCVTFYCPPNGGGGPSHMLSGSADGSVAIWQAGGGWEHLKLMKGHKGSVNALAVHPSGRVALSVAHDKSLRMWDLARGRCTYTAVLGAEAAEGVHFTPSGDTYTLMVGNKVTVHGVEGEGGLRATLTHTRRVLSVLQQSENVLITGLEDGSLKVWDLRTSSVQQSVERAHASRVRGLAAVSAGNGALPEQLASASSDGVVKLWDSRALSSSSATGRSDPVCLGQAATRARLTCLTVCNPKAPGSVQLPAPVAKPKAEVQETGQGKKQAGKQQQSRNKQGGQKQSKAQQRDYGFEVVRADSDDERPVPAPKAAAPKAAAAGKTVERKGNGGAAQQQVGKKQGPGSSTAHQPGTKPKPAHTQPRKPQQSATPKAGGTPKAQGRQGLGVQKGGVQKKVGSPHKAPGGGPAGGPDKKKFGMKAGMNAVKA